MMTVQPSASLSPAVSSRNDQLWNEAVEACAAKAEDRSAFGYVPDYGCFSCFENIAAAIRLLKRGEK